MTFYFAGNEQGVLSCIFVIKELMEAMLDISVSLFPQTGAPDMSVFYIRTKTISFCAGSLLVLLCKPC